MNVDILQRNLKLSCREILLMSSRLATWPTDIDTTDLRYDLREVDVDHQTSKCVAYMGPTLGKNRSFVANSHFPVTAKEHCRRSKTLQTSSSVPFTKIVYDKNLHCSMPVSSCIAYFEITIHRALRRTTAANTQQHQQQQGEEEEEFSPCVAIGIANHMHRLNKMPGWDAHSYAFHGDDGMFFHNWEFEGHPFTQRPEEATFGEGDTVGFGIRYGKLTHSTRTHLFLTINGRRVGEYRDSNGNFEKCTWFPCVGTDSHCPIEMNFGNKGVPFVFDVMAYEREVVQEYLCGGGSTVPTSTADQGLHAEVATKRGQNSYEVGADGLLKPLGIPRIPSTSFKCPYTSQTSSNLKTSSRPEPGLYRNRAFMQQVRMHIESNLEPFPFEEDSSESEYGDGDASQSEDSINSSEDSWGSVTESSSDSSSSSSSDSESSSSATATHCRAAAEPGEVAVVLQDLSSSAEDSDWQTVSDSQESSSSEGESEDEDSDTDESDLLGLSEGEDSISSGDDSIASQQSHSTLLGEESYYQWVRGGPY